LFFFAQLKGLLFVLRDLAVSDRVHLRERLVEPFLELVTGGEDLRQEEVK
jgi:hypothetical protein